MTCSVGSSGVAAAQTVYLVTKEVDLGAYQETLLEMQDVVQVRRLRNGACYMHCSPLLLTQV